MAHRRRDRRDHDRSVRAIGPDGGANSKRGPRERDDQPGSGEHEEHDQPAGGRTADGTLDDPERVAQLLPVERIEGDVEHGPVAGVDPGEHEPDDDDDAEAGRDDTTRGTPREQAEQEQHHDRLHGKPDERCRRAVGERSGHERHHDEEQDRDDERDPPPLSERPPV